MFIGKEADSIRQENEKRFNEYKSYLLAAGVNQSFISQLSFQPPLEQEVGFGVCFKGQLIEEYYENDGRQIVSPRSDEEEKKINEMMRKAGALPNIREKMQYAGELASGAVELKVSENVKLSEDLKKTVFMRAMPLLNIKKMAEERDQAIMKAAQTKGWKVYPSHEARYRLREAKKAGKNILSINTVEGFDELRKENQHQQPIQTLIDQRQTRKRRIFCQKNKLSSI